MAELGWPGLALPEEWGGQGLGIVELAVLFEEMGYALAPSPLLLEHDRRPGAGALRLRRPARALPAAAGRAASSAARRRSGTPARPATPGGFTMEAEADGDGVVLDGEKVLVLDAAAADFFLVATADGRRHLVERGADGVTVTAETVDRPHPPPLLGPLRRRQGRRRATRCRPRAPTTTPSSSGSASRSPPSRPGSPSGRWRWRSSTPKTASSSAARSAPTRRSRTAARRCCSRPRTRAPPSTAPPGPPTPSPSRCRWRPRWRRPTPPTPAGASPTPRSRSTAASASPGSTTSTSSSSAARRTRRCSATRSWHRERVADAILAAAAEPVPA